MGACECCVWHVMRACVCMCVLCVHVMRACVRMCVHPSVYGKGHNHDQHCPYMGKNIILTCHYSY